MQFQSLLCAIDGSHSAAKAFDFAVDLARRYEAGLSILHVLPSALDEAGLREFAEVEGLAAQSGARAGPAHRAGAHTSPDPLTEVRLGSVTPAGTPLPDELTENTVAELGERLVQHARSRASSAGIQVPFAAARDGDPGECILETSRELGVDGIVIGSRGLGPAKALLAGSVSRKVSAEAPCTCITVS